MSEFLQPPAGGLGQSHPRLAIKVPNGCRKKNEQKMLDGLSDRMDFPLAEKNVTGFANGVSDLEGSTECLIWQTDTTAGKNKKTTKNQMNE